MAKVGAQEVDFSYLLHMVGRYEVIKILNEFIVVGERYKYPICKNKSFAFIFIWKIR